MEMSSAKNFEIEIDSDAQETKEWIDALQSVIKAGGIERAHFLLSRLRESARQLNVPWRDSRNTPYVNTIPVQDEPAFPGGAEALETEQRLASLIRWNALAMVVRANRAYA